MSDDEVVVLLVCGGIGVIYWAGWLFTLGVARRRLQHASRSLPLITMPLVCAIVLYAILRAFASWDVRNSLPYLMFYMFMGAAWVALSMFLFRLFGLNPRLDAVERDNPAVRYALMGTLLGVTLTFAGANIGDGPGWWVVVYASACSTGALLLLWLLLAKGTGCLDALTVDRDRATGLRIAGVMIAAGAICGRAAAGDWVDGTELVTTFAKIAWAVAPLAIAEIFVWRIVRPTPRTPVPSPVTAGLVPAMFYVVFAVVYLGLVGSWELPGGA